MEPDEIIRRELTLEPKSRKELVEAQLKKGVKRPTAYRHLKALLKRGAINEIDGQKGVFTIPSALKKLEKIDAKELDFLLEEANKKKSAESINAALKELGNILRRSKVTKDSSIWDFYKKALDDESYQDYWSNLIDDLRVAACNLKQIGDNDSLDNIKNIFKTRMIEFIEPNQNQTILLSVTPLIETLFTDEASSIIFNRINEYITDAQIDDLNWSNFQGAILPQLRKFYKENKVKVWKWLFPLLEKNNETIKKRANKIYQDL